jgi:3',5'-cyclic AMP phosphodiesterase CpdA
MKLLAISDLHLSYEQNRLALSTIPAGPEDWLILAGDIGETREHLQHAIEVLRPRFEKLVWVPGNHELWTVPGDGDAHLRGEAKYRELVALCRTWDVVTPEDPYPVLDIGLERIRLVPMFLLYDYTFRPAHVPGGAAVQWAEETGVLCTDEHLLHADPYRDVVAWCRARCEATEARLQGYRDGIPTVLVNHWPLRHDLARLPRIPRFSIWCGTERTTDWHKRFNAKVVVSGHLHLRSTTVRDGTRFEEVSVGYPRQWSGFTTMGACVRQILPEPVKAARS